MGADSGIACASPQRYEQAALAYAIRASLAGPRASCQDAGRELQAARGLPGHHGHRFHHRGRGAPGAVAIRREPPARAVRGGPGPAPVRAAEGPPGAHSRIRGAGAGRAGAGGIGAVLPAALGAAARGRLSPPVVEGGAPGHAVHRPHAGTGRALHARAPGRRAGGADRVLPRQRACHPEPRCRSRPGARAHRDAGPEGGPRDRE